MRPVGIIRSQSQECTQKDRVRDSDGELLGDDGSADEAQSRNDVDEVSNATGQDDRCSGRKEAKDGWLKRGIGEQLDQEQAVETSVNSLLALFGRDDSLAREFVAPLAPRT